MANSALAGNTHIYRFQGAKESYQVGEEWSRIPVNGKLTSTESLNHIIQATARVDLPKSAGSAFYVGKYQGKHLMMTNFHVMPNSTDCRDSRVYFEYFRKRFRCSSFVAKFKDLETVFFTINVSKANEYIFENLAVKMDFTNDYKPGHRLVIAGYGQHKNTSHYLTYENSQTCMVASDTSKPKFLKVSSGQKSFNAYSFAHTCEISDGDSGSAIVSESTGVVIGINWSTSNKKPLDLKNSLTVFDWVEKQNPRVWESTSYGVPAKNILAMIRSTNNVLLNEFVSAQLLLQ